MLDTLAPDTIDIVIFSSRETEAELLTTIKHIDSSQPSNSFTIHVLINGNEALASSLAKFLQSNKQQIYSKCNVWSIPFGDKANAWNQYFHHIYCGNTVSVFIDGYVRVHKGAISRLCDTILTNEHALGGSGVPTVGASANRLKRQMLTEGGIHGNLCAIKSCAMNKIKKRDINLPLSLYRTDPTLGAILCFNLDPSHNKWDPSRLIVDPSVSWDKIPTNNLAISGIVSQIKRYFRQAQGVLENRAIHEFLARELKKPEQLHNSVRELCMWWIRKNRLDFIKLCILKPLVLISAIKLQRLDDSSIENMLLEPQRLYPL